MTKNKQKIKLYSYNTTVRVSNIQSLVCFIAKKSMLILNELAYLKDISVISTVHHLPFHEIDLNIVKPNSVNGQQN